MPDPHDKTDFVVTAIFATLRDWARARSPGPLIATDEDLRALEAHARGLARAWDQTHAARPAGDPPEPPR